MIAEDGTTFEVAKPNLEAPAVHTVVNVEKRLSEYYWHKLGFVRVTRLPPSGAEIARMVWHKDPLIKTAEDFWREKAITTVALNKDKFGKDDPNQADW